VPELAEVEYYRRRWDGGLGQRITTVKLHAAKRVFRGIMARELEKLLPGSKFQRSEARGKQLLFCFSNHLWLGLHLGMTGTLRVEGPAFSPGKHDHLVLCQRERSLVFNDPRLFGRVRFHQGMNPPEWWVNLPPALTSKAFTKAKMAGFLQRHGKLPVKAALLLQSGFPGIGNWMADEILWRARLNPLTLSNRLDQGQLLTLWRTLRQVCRSALNHISPDFSDPPRDWLFHQRWKRDGRCPIDREHLRRQPIAGRTTAWCPICQPG
jgi:formamidopyrimidine-DNA glycosylase